MSRSAGRNRLRSAARVHAGLRKLPSGDLHEQTGGVPLLILAPHPDDETLGCGGLIAHAVATGQPVSVLVLTDGTMSHPNSRAWPAARLRRVREEESRHAASALGLDPAHVEFLGLPDTRAPRDGEAARRAASAIAAHAERVGARALFTTWRHDPHADHLAASILGGMAAALTGAVLFEYPVWGWTLPPRRLLDAGDPLGFRLDVADNLAAKRRAIACHRSQLGQVVLDDPAGFVMEQTFVELFTGRWETFLRIASL
jgi:LmbE family N-acetylglucosaminyl deacetylase